MTTSASCGENKRSTSTSSSTKEDHKSQLDFVLTEERNTTNACEAILLNAQDKQVNAQDEQLKSPRLSPYSLKNIMKWRFTASSKASASNDNDGNERKGIAAFLGRSMHIRRHTDHNINPGETVNGSSKSKHWFSFKRKGSINKFRSNSVKEIDPRSKLFVDHNLLKGNQFNNSNNCSSGKDKLHKIVEQNRTLLNLELTNFFENRKLKSNTSTCQSTCYMEDKKEIQNTDTSVDASSRVYSKIYDEPWCSILDTTTKYAQIPSYLDLASDKKKVLGVTKVFDTIDSTFAKYKSGGTISLESFCGSTHMTAKVTTAVQTDTRNSTYVTAKVTTAVQTDICTRYSTHITAKLTTAVQTDNRNSAQVTAKVTTAVQTDDVAHKEHNDFETNLRKLSIQEVGDILDILDLTQFKPVFESEHIDGDILSRLSCEDLITELTFKKLEALRLYTYIQTERVQK